MTLKKGIFIIPVIIAIVLIGAPASYVVTKNLNKPKLIRPYSHQSNPNAKIKIVTFVDYECLPCGDIHETTKKVVTKNAGDVNLVVRHRLGEGHENAELAAIAAEAAADQGKFFEMNDKLLENQQEWANSTNPQEVITQYAKELNLNVDKFQQDVSSGKYEDRIKTDEKDANGLKVDVIPTTFVNGKNVGYAPSEKVLNSEISFLKSELERIEDDPDYRDPETEQDLIEYSILIGVPLIIIICGLIVLGRIRDLHKRAKKIRKRIDELESQKKKR